MERIAPYSETQFIRCAIFQLRLGFCTPRQPVHSKHSVPACNFSINIEFLHSASPGLSERSTPAYSFAVYFEFLYRLKPGSPSVPHPRAVLQFISNFCTRRRPVSPDAPHPRTVLQFISNFCTRHQPVSPDAPHLRTVLQFISNICTRRQPVSLNAPHRRAIFQLILNFCTQCRLTFEIPMRFLFTNTKQISMTGTRKIRYRAGYRDMLLDRFERDGLQQFRFESILQCLREINSCFLGSGIEPRRDRKCFFDRLRLIHLAIMIRISNDQ